MKRILFVLFCLAICFNAVFAAEPTNGGDLRIAISAVTHLDPQSMANESEAFAMIFQPLFEMNEDWEPVGLLVESYEVSEDGKTHIWHLRQGVKFSDGTDFDANVVKWNIERKINNSLPYYDSIPWESIEVIDPYTVKVTLSTHSLTMYYYLTSFSYSMYCPTFVESHDAEDLKNQAVGTGPFVIEEYRPNDYIKMVRNENYWDPDRIHFDEVEFFIVSDANTRSMMLEAGEVDFIRDVSTTEIDYFNSIGDDVLAEFAPSTRNYHVTLHNLRPPLDNPEVRQAFNYAIDKDGMNQAIFQNKFGISKDLFTVTEYVNGYYEQPVYEYNPEKAKELLEKNGLVDIDGDGYREWNGEKKEFVFVTRKGQRPGDIEIAEQVQALLGEVGINVKIEIMDTATYFTNLNQPMEDAPYYDMSNQSPSSVGDKEFCMSNYVRCNSWPGNKFNYSHYCNEEVDSILDIADAQTNLEDRNKYYNQATEIVWNEAPAIFLFDGINSSAHVSKLDGIYSVGSSMIWILQYGWFN